MNSFFQRTIYLIIAILLVGVNFPPVVARAGRAVYVSSSSSQARDASSYGSLSRPWKTLDYALKQLKPGDTLYVRGGTYSNKNIVLTSANSGTSGAEITVKKYEGESVILKGGGKIIFRGANWWVMDGLTFDGFQDIGLQIGAHKKIGSGVTAKSDHITIRNSVFKNSQFGAIYIDYGDNILIDNCKFFNIRPRISYKSNPGTKINKEVNAIGIRYISKNITIRRSSFEEIGSDGVQIGSKAVVSGSDLRGIKILDSKFWVDRPYQGILGNVGENGIDVKAAIDVLISGNTIRGFRPTISKQDASGSHGEGVVIHNNAQNVTIEKNLFDDNTINIDISAGTKGSKQNTRNFVIRDNDIRNAKSSGGERGYGVRLADVTKVEIYRNVFYNNTIYLRAYNVSNLSFKNNTVYKGEAVINTSNTSVNSQANTWSQLSGSLPQSLKSNDDRYVNSISSNISVAMVTLSDLDQDQPADFQPEPTPEPVADSQPEPTPEPVAEPAGLPTPISDQASYTNLIYFPAIYR